MTLLPARRHSLAWNGANVAAGIVLCGLLGLLLVRRHLDRPLAAAERIGVWPRRVKAARERINPNVAGVASLLRLPEVGPARARAIVAWRQAHGPAPFRSAGDLAAVRGIGPVTVRRLAPLLTFPPAASGPSPPARSGQ